MMFEDLVDKGQGVVKHHLLSKEDSTARLLHICNIDYQTNKKKVTKKNFERGRKKGKKYEEKELEG